MAEIPDVTATGAAQGLGRLVWFSVQAFELSRDLLLEKWKESGLPEGDFIPAPRAPDCFKSAVRKIADLEEEEGQEIRRYNVEREIGKPDVRHIILMHYLRGTDKPFSFEDIGTFNFNEDAPSEQAVTGKLFKEGFERWAFLSELVQREYLKLLTTHNEIDVRTAVQRKLRQWHALLMRPTGGVYFVGIQHADEADRYARFLRAIESEMWSIKVSKGVEETQMVAQKLEEHAQDVKDKTNKLEQDAQGMTDETKQKAVRQQIADQLEELAKMQDSYQGLLGD